VQEPDLITRYNLTHKIIADDVGEAQTEEVKSKQGWSQSKSERQEMLKRRRDEMILNARRKMLEKEKGKGKEGS
jgi:coupling of ubiquitin conjugation to ER degradation protein 1